MDTLPKDKPFDLKVRGLVSKTALSLGLHTTTPEGEEGPLVHTTITDTSFIGKDVRRNPLAEYRKAVRETYHQLSSEERTTFSPYRFEVLYDGEIAKFTVTQSLMRVVTHE